MAKKFTSKKTLDSNEVRLSAYEQSIEDSLDVGKLKKPSAQAQEQIKSAASDALRDLKSSRANIRMSENDFLAIRALADKLGMPYQTLIAHIIHLYITDQLVNVNEVKKLLDAGILDRKIG